MEISQEFWDWVAAHGSDDTAALRMKMRGKEISGRSAADAILQIECRRKYASKFRETLAEAPHFYFPGTINAEQATSDRLAQYHAGLIAPGLKVADLTAGLGIDAMHIARKSKSMLAIEQDGSVAMTLEYNTRGMGIDNLTVQCRDCVSWLAEQQPDSYDCLWIDPARRASDGSRVYALTDCSPDLSGMQQRMLEVAPVYVAKLSPMLDISLIASSLTNVSHIIAIGTSTECKELVVKAEREFTGVAAITAATLFADGSASHFSFTADDERTATARYGLPKAGDTLFEPYPAVMKAAAIKLLSERYVLTKIAANTQLYFSNEVGCDSLPGNSHKIEAVLPYSSSEIKRFARRWPRAMVSARNFGITAESLRAKLGVRDGAGSVHVYGVSDNSGKRYLIVAS